jgi:hypothetical protein
MNGVELYAKVRYPVRIEGTGRRDAERRFGIDPRTVAKMLSFSLPPGYRRSRPPARPKLDPFVGIIERILEEDSLQDGATADALRTVCDLDLTDLQAIDEPRGFGRDSPISPPQGHHPSHRRQNRDPWQCSIPPRRQKALAGAFWHPSLMHSYSDPPMHFCSGLHRPIKQSATPHAANPSSHRVEQLLTLNVLCPAVARFVVV